MRIVEDRIKIYKSSRISRFLFSLLGAGYDSTSEKLFSIVLILGSLLLATASLYTTIKGLNEYIPFIFALFVGVGIQSLLTTVSWRIGATLYTKKVKLPLLIIYALTLTTSVFFSYSALLDNIYDKKHRSADELERSISKGTKITGSLVNDLKDKTRSLGDSLIIFANDWNKNAVEYISRKYSPIKKEFNKKNISYQSKLDLVYREIHKGITPVKQLGEQIIYSDTGRGTNAITYENDAQNYYYRHLGRLEQKVKKIDSLQVRFDSTYKNFTINSEHVTIGNYSDYIGSYNQLLFELSDESETRLPAFPDSIIKRISEINRPNSFIVWYENEFNLLKCKDIEETKESLLNFINKYPTTLSSAMEEKLLNEIKSIGKYGGDNVHQFVLAMGELSNGNPLAFASLFFALIIDGLLLFCGIIGSKPDSFLKMKTIEDLENIQQYALEIVLSLDLDKIQNYDSSYVKRIALILKATKANLQTAIEGYPGLINIEQAESLFLTKEISVFISFRLARRTKDGKSLALSTRLILFLTEQVINYEVENKLGDFKTT